MGSRAWRLAGAAVFLVAMLGFAIRGRCAEPDTYDLGIYEWGPKPGYVREGMVGKFRKVIDLRAYRRDGLSYYWIIDTRISGQGRVYQMKTQHAMDCTEHTYAINAVKEYDKAGKMFKNAIISPLEWSAIAPDTLGALEFKIVCE
jgi:hypothetical protein